ncbi:RhoGAP domain-containing protein [Fusarium austroafricanum]|uniref:RhoGAP domain-containing protein n=1 Tax=Fusarium austroafricanum TaxID=2364996 RepID=A0A8H4KT19_9HYPO|nr:RhoGAP domain-containing protein [Fusarium austroafricanum]
MADPLSVTASVVGILTATGKVLSLLGQIVDAPQSIADMQSEVDDIRIIFSNLQSFLDRSQRLKRGRLALIQLGDLVAVLTRTIIAFSELETIVRPLCTGDRMSPWRRVHWRWQEAAALRLVNQLQRHKTSLSLLLQIYQCESDLEAYESATTLRDNIEHELDDDNGLSERLANMEISPELDELSTAVYDVENASIASTYMPGRSHQSSLDAEIPRRSSPAAVDSDGNVSKASSGHPPEQPTTIEGAWSADTACGDFSKAFEEILLASWVYRRNQDGPVDGVSTINTTRSRAWSILSGITLSMVSTISVIKLPLTQSEIERFTSLAILSIDLEPKPALKTDILIEEQRKAADPRRPGKIPYTDTDFRF